MSDRKKLTPAQMDNLVRVSLEMSRINGLIKCIDGNKRTIILTDGLDSVAVTDQLGSCYYNPKGENPINSTFDPQLFAVVREYLDDKKKLLVEEVEAIISEEGGEI